MFDADRHAGVEDILNEADRLIYEIKKAEQAAKGIKNPVV